MTDNEKNSITELTDKEKLLVQKAWDCVQPFEVRDIVAQQEETIKHQKEHIESLIAGQETLQKYIAEKDAEIERLNRLLEGWKKEAYKVADEKDKLYCEAVETVKAIKKFYLSVDDTKM